MSLYIYIRVDSFRPSPSSVLSSRFPLICNPILKSRISIRLFRVLVLVVVAYVPFRVRHRRHDNRPSMIPLPRVHAFPPRVNQSRWMILIPLLRLGVSNHFGLQSLYFIYRRIDDDQTTSEEEKRTEAETETEAPSPVSSESSSTRHSTKRINKTNCTNSFIQWIQCRRRRDWIGRALTLPVTFPRAHTGTKIARNASGRRFGRAPSKRRRRRRMMIMMMMRFV